MSKFAAAGAMRTRIIVCDRAVAQDADGYETPDFDNIYPEGIALRCQWQNAFGADALEAEKLGLTDSATLTMRFDPRVDPTCILFRDRDPRPFEVISVNNVLDQGRYMEVRVKRMVAAK